MGLRLLFMEGPAQPGDSHGLNVAVLTRRVPPQDKSRRFGAGSSRRSPARGSSPKPTPPVMRDESNAPRSAPGRITIIGAASSFIGQITYARRLRLTGFGPSFGNRLRALVTTAL